LSGLAVRGGAGRTSTVNRNRANFWVSCTEDFLWGKISTASFKWTHLPITM